MTDLLAPVAMVVPVLTPLLAGVLLSAVGAEPSATLRWGADAQGGAPYVFQDPVDPNRLVGFEVDLADALSARLHRKPRPVSGPWEQLLELLKRGDFDVALNGIEVADEKKRVVLLTRPYLRVAEVLTVRKGDANAPRTRQALAGRAVGTLPGSMASRILEQLGADVRTYEGGQDDIYADLEQGRTDAVLLDGPVALYYGEVNPAFEAVPGDFGEVDYAVALRLEDHALKAELDAALGAMVADGSLVSLYQRWGLWTPRAAALLGVAATGFDAPAPELDRWKVAMGRPLPFLERVRTRYPQVLPLFARGAALTLAVSVCSMLLAIALGLSLAIGRRYGPRALSVLCTLYVEFFRGTPLLVQLTLVYFGLPELGLKLSPFVAGVVALGLNYAAAEAENYRAGLESVPVGQLEAATVLGLRRAQTLRYVLGPQAMRVAIPPMTNDFIALLKDSSLVSVVTLTELTRTYSTLANSMRDHLGLGVLVALFYLLLGLPFARLARVVETRLGRHLRQESK